jgi:hypothetical protein
VTKYHVPALADGMVGRRDGWLADGMVGWQTELVGRRDGWQVGWQSTPSCDLDKYI